MLSISVRIFCCYRVFCHRTESDLLLFLIIRFNANHFGNYNAILDFKGHVMQFNF